MNRAETPVPIPPDPAPASPAKRPSIPQVEVSEIFGKARQRGLPANGLLLIADVHLQRLIVAEAANVVFDYAMSSSKYGTGNKVGSNQTPLGWHRISERIGGDQIHGRSFTSRRPDAVVLDPTDWRSDGGRDYVLTRILWLTGLEPGVNAGGSVDSHERCIYIHGTNQEHLLGQPASHGCIRLSNRDVMELYDVADGREVYCLIR